MRRVGLPVVGLLLVLCTIASPARGDTQIAALGAISTVDTVWVLLAAMGVVFFAIKSTVGLRVSKEEELRGLDVEVNLLKKTRIEIAVNDDFVQPTIDAIVCGARTGKIGDGKIFAVPLERCIRIRTGEEGNDAIG